MYLLDIRRKSKAPLSEFMQDHELLVELVEISMGTVLFAERSRLMLGREPGADALPAVKEFQPMQPADPRRAPGQRNADPQEALAPQRGQQTDIRRGPAPRAQPSHSVSAPRVEQHDDEDDEEYDDDEYDDEDDEDDAGYDPAEVQRIYRHALDQLVAMLRDEGRPMYLTDIQRKARSPLSLVAKEPPRLAALVHASYGAVLFAGRSRLMLGSAPRPWPGGQPWGPWGAWMWPQAAPPRRGASAMGMYDPRQGPGWGPRAKGTGPGSRHAEGGTSGPPGARPRGYPPVGGFAPYGPAAAGVDPWTGGAMPVMWPQAAQMPHEQHDGSWAHGSQWSAGEPHGCGAQDAQYGYEGPDMHYGQTSHVEEWTGWTGSNWRAS